MPKPRAYMAQEVRWSGKQIDVSYKMCCYVTIPEVNTIAGYYITKASLVNTILKIETISNILYNKLKSLKFKRSDYKFKPKINTVQFNLITYYSTEFWSTPSNRKIGTYPVMQVACGTIGLLLSISSLSLKELFIVLFWYFISVQ